MIARSRPHTTVRRAVVIVAALIVGIIWLLNHWVINNTEAYVYSSWSLLPETPVGLVLGTSPYTRTGQSNPQFQGRIEAAAQLYQLGKVQHLLLSGAHTGPNYNEPQAMRKALLRRGVPASAMTLDFAGDRTFDSVARADLVFGLHRFTIITQRYHAYRAEFIAKKLGLHDVVAYAAPGGAELGPLSRTRFREALARVKAVLDIYVLDTQPRLGGDRRKIVIAPAAPASASAPTVPPSPPTAAASQASPSI
ncbi:MAG TPA: ElyC/SanA/YdcF family protein [Nevskiaceae bacterium]|nr:ElyC/SanA/YdcF family protein [Nevskiaceae bacterium]